VVDDVGGWLRATIARLTDADPETVRALPDDTPLLSGGVNLDSLNGAGLLAAVNQRFGVDVAAQDLALDSLESIATLRDYIEAHAH
jgi:acyl carrier protein